MAPNLALAITIAFILWLFRKDRKLRQFSSSALWIPAVWLTIAGSKGPANWLANFGVNVGTNEGGGNAVDLLVLTGLMMGALLVLIRRRFDWITFCRENKALVLIYLYLTASTAWSEIPFETLKRALKDFGNVLVALVLLTEMGDPLDAMRIVYVRVAYILYPLSVVFIKYFPLIGRGKFRAGDSMFVGVCTHKNSLGLTVFVLGLFVVLDLWMMKRRPVESQKKDIWIRYGLLWMAVWLLLTCESRTSLVCLILGSILFWATGKLLQAKEPKRMIYRVVGLVITLVVLENTLDLSGLLLEALGRDRTLTGRTAIWESVQQTHPNPLLGCGFYSFWSTDAALEISKGFKGTLKTVHNGFLEMYVDGGAIGVALLILLLLSWGKRSVERLLQGSFRGRLAITFWILAIMYNFSETDYFRIETLWFTLLALMMEYPSRQVQVTEEKASVTALLHPA